ncbi:protein-glutamine glutaminase family protein [Actinoallomurus sp. CA-150999]|uniref:protein-glutamine glutaminase family protein n=1 Tax=Actinoallomurus sp. CA-150999 TaxID=3239887 RepID=UPI003D8CF1A6
MVTTGFEAHFESWTKSGRGFGELSDSLATAVDTLVGELSGAGAAWGNDDIGQAFLKGSEGSAGFGAARDGCLAALEDAVNLVRATGGMLVVAGQQYQLAESASTVGGDIPKGADHDAVAAKDPYRRPEADFNGVAGEFDELPGIVQQGLFFLEMLVGGCQWPDGSMDGLARMQSALSACANAVGQAAGELDDHAGAVTSLNAGEATDKFKTFAQALSGGGELGGLRFLEGTLQGLASWVEGLQAQKRAARLQFELSCAFVVITMAIGFAWSWITAGASEAAAIGASEAEGFALKTFLQRIAVWAGQHQVLSGALVGAWFGGGMDAAGQYARIHEGVQKGWNWGEFGKSVGMGAVAGGVMGLAGRAVARESNPLTTKLADWMRAPGMKGVGARFGFAGTTGTAGNLASQAIFDPDHMNVGQAAAFGFGMAGLGGAKELGQHVAGRFGSDGRGSTTGGGDDGPPPPPPSGGAPHGDDGPQPPPPSGGTGHPYPDTTGGDAGHIPPSSGTHGTDLASAGKPETPTSGGTSNLPESPNVGGQSKPVLGGNEGYTGGSERGPATSGQPGPAVFPVRPPEAGPTGARPGESARPSISEMLNGDSRTGRQPGTASGRPEGTTGGGPRPGTGEGPRPGESGSGTRPGEGPTGGQPRPADSRATTAEPGASSTDRAKPAPFATDDRPTGQTAGQPRPAAEPATPRGDNAEPTTSANTAPRPEAREPGVVGVPVGHSGHGHGTGTSSERSGSSPIEKALNGKPDDHQANTPQDPRLRLMRDDHSSPSESHSPAVRPPEHPPRPTVVDRTFISEELRRAGFADPVPAPEVPPQVLSELRPTGPLVQRDGRPSVDLVRLTEDVRSALGDRHVDGADLLSRIHELRQDPVAAHHLDQSYRLATGRDLRSDITRAYQEGRLPFDPNPYVDHLLPDPTTAQRLRNDPITTPEQAADFARQLHDAINAADGPKVSELLNRIGRRPDDVWGLEQHYQHHFNSPLKGHINEKFGQSSEAGYLAHLLGDGQHETRVLSISEAKGLYDKLATETFRTRQGTEARIPFGHPEDGCYDRAHRMAKKLAEWGYSSRKIFAVRQGPGSLLTVQADSARGAAWGKPGYVGWGYHVAPIVEVRSPSGKVFEVVIDPSLRRGALGLDEWLGLMGVTRNDYVRFDTVGPLPEGPANIVDGLLGNHMGSDTAMVYTTPREIYYPNQKPIGSLHEADGYAHTNQETIEGYARVSEARELGNHIRQAAAAHGWLHISSSAKAIADTVRNDPAFRMLLDDVRAGRPWPPDVTSIAGTLDMPLRVVVAKRAYDILSSTEGPPAGSTNSRE